MTCLVAQADVTDLIRQCVASAHLRPTKPHGQAHPRPNLRSPGFAIIRKDCEDCRCLLRRVLQYPAIASAYVELLLRHVQALDRLQLGNILANGTPLSHARGTLLTTKDFSCTHCSFAFARFVHVIVQVGQVSNKYIQAFLRLPNCKHQHGQVCCYEPRRQNCRNLLAPEGMSNRQHCCEAPLS